MRQITTLNGIIDGIHSDWAYKQLEVAVDGIIDFKLDESGEETRDIMRIRNMKNASYDRRWHQLKIKENFEVTLEK